MVTSTLKTPTGVVESAWTYEDEIFRWTFTIPANATAEVHIPTSDPESIKGLPESQLRKANAETSLNESEVVYSLGPGEVSVQGLLSIVTMD